MPNFSESGHTVFRGSSALERRDLKSKGKGTLSIHFCGDDKTAQLVIISVNQLSIYGAGLLVVQIVQENLLLRTIGYSYRIDDNEHIASDR